MISTERKVVELLRLLGNETSESVLAKLRPERAVQIRQQMEADSSPLSAERQMRILNEFDRVFAVFRRGSTGPQLHRPTEEDAADPRSPRSGVSKPAAARTFVPTGDALQDLERINVHQVASAMESEQPRTVAAMLSELSPERTAEVLSLFPEEARDAVVRELSGATRAHPVLVQRMAQAVLSRAMTMPADPPERPDRVQRLASVLRAVDRPLRKKMLESIREQDAETADGLLGKMYVFDDIEGLRDRQIQKLLTEVDTRLISSALSGASAAIRDKILNNLSKRARDALMDEMQYQTEIPQEEVTTARNQIALTIARIDQEN